MAQIAAHKTSNLVPINETACMKMCTNNLADDRFCNTFKVQN